MTQSGHCNPVCKEAPHASQCILCVLEGLASREEVCREPHTMRRHRPVGVIGGERKRVCVSGGRVDPVIRRPVLPDAVRRTPGCSGLYTRCRTTIVMAKLSRSACIDTGPVGGPQAHDDAHRCAPGRTAGRERCRGDALRRLASDGMCRHDPPAEGVGRAPLAWSKPP